MMRGNMHPTGRLVVLLLLVGMALLVHLTGMGIHEMSMLGSCFAVLQAVILGFFLALVVRRSIDLPARRMAPLIDVSVPPAIGRYPPDDGTVLRR